MYAQSSKNTNLVFFDFDGTLCAKDSFTGFIFYALRKRHIVKQSIKILPWIQAYYLNIYPADSMRPKLFKAMFSDMNVSELQQLAEDYSRRLLQDALDEKLYTQFLKHQKNGDTIVIVSASVDLYLKPIAELLDADLICTETQIEFGRFSGAYSTPDCSSEQKKSRILEKYNLDQYNYIYAYGNSKEDLEMLSLADFTYMVGETEGLPPIQIQKQFA